MTWRSSRRSPVAAGNLQSWGENDHLKRQIQVLAVALRDYNLLEDLKFLHSGSWHFWYQTSSFKSTIILQRKVRAVKKKRPTPRHILQIILSELYAHDVIAFMKPAHILTPAVFGNVVCEKLFSRKVVPPSDTCSSWTMSVKLVRSAWGHWRFLAGFSNITSGKIHYLLFWNLRTDCFKEVMFLVNIKYFLIVPHICVVYSASTAVKLLYTLVIFAHLLTLQSTPLPLDAIWVFYSI